MKWTFERTPPTGAGTYTADTNMPGKTTGARLNGAAGYGAQITGNGSAAAFGSQEWDVGDYYEFKLGTTGYQNISVSFAQTSSSSGPRDFAFTFSTDGGTTFTQVGTYMLGTETWSKTSANASSVRTPDLSSYATALANQDVVIFRLVDTSTVSAGGGTVIAGATSRVDDFTISGDVVSIPEPATYVGGALFLGALGWRRWRR